MSRLVDFVLEASICQPHSEIHEFFCKSPLRWWKDVYSFAKVAYAKNPTKTAEQVFNEYIESLIAITRLKHVNPGIVEHAESVCKAIVVCFSMFTCYSND